MKPLILILLVLNLKGYGQDTTEKKCYDSLEVCITTYPPSYEWQYFEVPCPLTKIDFGKNVFLARGTQLEAKRDTLYCHIQLETHSGMIRIIEAWIVQHDFYNDYLSFDRKRKYDRNKIWGYKIIQNGK